jgi:hypothetical protein
VIWCRREEVEDLVKAMLAATKQLRDRKGRRLAVITSRITEETARAALTVLVGSHPIVVEGSTLVDLDEEEAWGPKHKTPRRADP